MAALLSVICVVIGWLLWLSSQASVVVGNSPQAPLVLPPPESFMYVHVDGTSLRVTRDSVTDTLFLEGGGYEPLRLQRQTTVPEREIYVAEDESVTVTLDGNMLTMREAAGVTFVGTQQAAAPTSLLGQTWYWQGLMTPDGTRVVAKAPLQFPLVFNPDGTLTVGTDCNQHGGVYEADGTKLFLSSLFATKMYCTDAQESRYVTALQSVASFTRITDTLLLEGADGTVLTFTLGD